LLHAAVRDGQLALVKLLLEKGANPNLQLKLRPPYRNVVFDRGGDSVLSTGATPLLHAAKVGDAKFMALLLQHKALVDLPTATGVTPLMAAAFMGQGSNPSRGRWKTEADGVACLKLLMDAGADVNARNAQGQTALHVAAQRGYNNIVKLLAERGADLMAKDADGHSALDYATGLPNPRGPAPVPQKETVTLLGQLIAAKPMVAATTAKR